MKHILLTGRGGYYIYYIEPYDRFNNISKHDNKNYVTSMTYIDCKNVTYSVNPFSMIRTTNNIINKIKFKNKKNIYKYFNTSTRINYF